MKEFTALGVMKKLNTFCNKHRKNVNGKFVTIYTLKSENEIPIVYELVEAKPKQVSEPIETNVHLIIYV